MRASGAWDRLLEQDEGQFLERKSCYDRSSGQTRPNPLKKILQDVAESLAAMANADGGIVAVGLDDDGAVTGVPSRYELQKAQRQLGNYIRPALKFRAYEIQVKGQRVWVFETDWSPEVHQLSDGRYLLRVGAENLPFPAKDIEAMKASRRQNEVASTLRDRIHPLARNCPAHRCPTEHYQTHPYGGAFSAAY